MGAHTLENEKPVRAVLTFPDGMLSLPAGTRFDLMAWSLTVNHATEFDDFGRVVYSQNSRGRRDITVSCEVESVVAVPPTEPATWSIIDLHGTLVSRALNEASLAALADLYQCPAKTLLEAYRGLEADYDTDEISLPTFWRVLQFVAGLPDRPALTGDAHQILVDSIHILPGAEELLARLAERGPVMLATNTKRELLESLRTKFPTLFEKIALVVPSYELRCRKPSNEFFLRVLLKLRDRGVGGDARPLWIDDDVLVCRAAERFVFRPIHCTSALQALRELDRYEIAEQ